MARWRDVALAAGLALEGLAALAAARGGEPAALALHAIACGASAAGLHRRLLAGAAGSGLLFALGLFVPVLGVAGLAVAARLAPPAPATPRQDVIRTRVPGLAEAPRAAPPPAPAGGPFALGRVGAARGRCDPGAISLLRRSLAHPEEDVRLVAFSVLESKSRAAYRDVHESERELAAAPPDRLGGAHRRAAARHWEIARLGLAEGECLAHALDRARLHALAASDGEPSLHLLLGRIELGRGDARAAEAALTRAVELGLPPEIALPYLAEAAFLDRRLELVRRRLAALPARTSPAVDRVRRYWT